MTSEIIDNTLAETPTEDEAVAKAAECCLKAEQALRNGSIGLTQLYEEYEKAISPGAYDNYGPWAKIVSRACRVARRAVLKKSGGFIELRRSNNEIVDGYLWCEMVLRGIRTKE